MPARRAYGAHRKVTNEQKAQFIAESIMFRIGEGREWRFDEYGATDDVRTMAEIILAVEIEVKLSCLGSAKELEMWKIAFKRIS